MIGVSRCLLPGRELGNHVNSPPCKKTTFYFALISAALDPGHFSFDQSACKCHPRLIGMAAFKGEFLLESDLVITSGCSCYLLNVSPLQNVKEKTVKSTHAHRGCSFLKFGMDSVKHFAP